MRMSEQQISLQVIYDYQKSLFELLNKKVDLVIDSLRTKNNVETPKEPIVKFKPISSAKEFYTIEKKLNKFSTTNEYPADIKNEMIFLARKLECKPKFDKKIGLMMSLLSTYFEQQFIEHIGWAAYKDRLALNDSDGHKKFFFEIVNINTPSCYANLNEATKSMVTAMQRIHEKTNKIKRDAVKKQKSPEKKAYMSDDDNNN